MVLIGRVDNTIKASGDWFMVAGHHQPIKFMLIADPSLHVGGMTDHPPRIERSPPEITMSVGTMYTFNLADYRFRGLEL